MRPVFSQPNYTPYFRDLDVAGSIENSEGRIITNADAANTADSDRLMIDTNKKLVIKIQDSLHSLVIEDNEIKFKEI
jgi:hypothetical protein